MKLTETNMQIICNSDTNEGGIQVWSHIKVPSLFTNYQIQSNSNNEIALILSSDALLGALKSASANPAAGVNIGTGGQNGAAPAAVSSFETEEVVMKLAKKNSIAMLSFEVYGMTRAGRTIRVSHDVKVDVMRTADVAKLSEPMCPEPDVTVLLPPLHKIRIVVERLRPMSNILAIRGNNNGGLQLAINTEGVKVETEWRNCTNPQMRDPNNEEEDPEEKDPDQKYTVHISIRSFLKFLNVHSVSSTTIACICHHHCLILYVYIGEVADAGGVLTFYIPAIIDDD
ncbi:cell cycle checkpoint [Coprinopsis marcescibilis]|uniref:Checkpoint protein n=1 Tax=Coprinopsis marcescibilis TaxID=230819 RepID=A0A5C3KGA1_COPMA|nr:cell cycle checkpoint [Coprinopsis marcescibilis]